MDLKRIKTVMIVLLIAVNAFFLYNIISNYRENNYIDDATISNACEILEKSEIYVERAAVPKKKIDLSVYESFFYDSHNESIVEAVSGSGVERTFSLPDGMRFVSENGDTVEFTGQFGISYLSHAAKREDDFEKIIEDAVFRGEAFIVESVYKKTKNMLSDDVSPTVGPAKLGVVCAATHFDDKSGYSVIKFTQTMDGTPIYSHDVFCVFDGEELLYMSGLWCFLPTDAKYSSQHYDQINILFMEKKNIEKEREENKDAEENAEPEYRIEKVDAVYCTYFNNDKSGVYFIPAWRITYGDGRESVYDAGSGTRYVGVE